MCNLNNVCFDQTKGSGLFQVFTSLTQVKIIFYFKMKCLANNYNLTSYMFVQRVISLTCVLFKASNYTNNTLNLKALSSQNDRSQYLYLIQHQGTSPSVRELRILANIANEVKMVFTCDKYSPFIFFLHMILITICRS